jgi:protein-disulfide isomerase
VLAVIVLGIAALQRPAAVAPLPSGPTSAASTVQAGVTADGFQSKGDPAASIVVTEYADFQCPGCAYYATNVSASIEQEYIASGKVLFVFHEYPLEFHANAVPAAEAARCAADQGGFWKMHDLLFARQNEWAELANPSTQFFGYAKELGLDQASFSACLTQHTHQGDVLKARDSGDALGLPGTPSFAVNGTVVDTTGAQTVDDIVSRLRATIDAELAR